MAEQTERHSKTGRADCKRATCRERRQMERRVAHDHLGEVRRMRDASDELDWCDLVSPPARIAYHGWVE